MADRDDRHERARRTRHRRPGALGLLTATVAVSALALPIGSGAASASNGNGNGSTNPPATASAGDLGQVARTIGADVVRAGGIAGRGVDVAVIDTGISPVAGLDAPGKIVNGPDLSFDNGDARLRWLDGNGHGTHMAAIIAGNDAAHGFSGIAPDARLVNVKVGANTGAVDVSQVIAALDWIVEHRTQNGLNIRVVNLSFGTNGVQPTLVDPLARAVERAWFAGIVVVVASGNDGRALTGLATPATDPYVITVGPAEQVNGTWQVPSFASNGNGLRDPDVVAPGRSIQSLRVPGGRVDTEYPSARVGDRLFLGSGSSQAAAVVSGAVALMLQQSPKLTPDQVKELLRSTADPLPTDSARRQGKGMVDLDEAVARKASGLGRQLALPSTGLGLLQLSRGLDQVALAGIPLIGERTANGVLWNGRLWVLASLTNGTWAGGSWSGGSWSGGTWMGGSWSGGSWSGGSWSGGSWSGGSWSGGSWSGGSWSGGSWSGGSWS
ncbi:MAG: S8 family serine peptidase [Acidimicrobiales bacterium]